MVNYYANPAEASFQSTYIPIDFNMLMKWSDQAAQQRKENEEALREYNRAFGSFHSYSDKDMNTYNNMVMNPLKDLVNNISSNPDSIKGDGGKNAINKFINNIDYGKLARLNASAKGFEDYIKNYDERWGDNPLDHIKQYDSVNNGVFAKKPLVYEDAKKISDNYFDNIPIQLLKNQSTKYLNVYGIGDDTIKKAVSNFTPQLYQNEQMQKHFGKMLAEKGIDVNSLNPEDKQKVFGEWLYNLQKSRVGVTKTEQTMAADLLKQSIAMSARSAGNGGRGRGRGSGNDNESTYAEYTTSVLRENIKAVYNENVASGNISSTIYFTTKDPNIKMKAIVGNNFFNGSNAYKKRYEENMKKINSMNSEQLNTMMALFYKQAKDYNLNGLRARAIASGSKSNIAYVNKLETLIKQAALKGIDISDLNSNVSAEFLNLFNRELKNIHNAIGNGSAIQTAKTDEHKAIVGAMNSYDSNSIRFMNLHKVMPWVDSMLDVDSSQTTSSTGKETGKSDSVTKDITNVYSDNERKLNSLVNLKLLKGSKSEEIRDKLEKLAVNGKVKISKNSKAIYSINNRSDAGNTIFISLQVDDESLAKYIGAYGVFRGSDDKIYIETALDENIMHGSATVVNVNSIAKKRNLGDYTGTGGKSTVLDQSYDVSGYFYGQ